MPDLSDLLEHDLLVRKAVGTVAWLALVLALRAVLLRIVRGAEWDSNEQRLRWRVRTIQVAALVLVFGLLFLWASEVESLALSAIAIAAAIVIAMKEIILCLNGSILRAGSDGFSIGNRVRIGDLRGDVIHTGFFTTTLLEVGPSHHRTGASVTLPNALLLTTPVQNESFTEAWVLHTFQVPVGSDGDWRRAEEALLTAARAATGDYEEPAARHMERISREHDLPFPSAEPRVLIQLAPDGAVVLMARVPAPATARGRVEQAILRAYLETVRPAAGSG